LRSAGHDIEEINYAKAALTEQTVKAIVAAAGSVAAVLNTRHATAKQHGWATAPPSAAVFARAVVADANLLRRAIVGFDRAAYAKL